MKSKKLISLLCAAALTASSFAAFAVTASADASDPVWSWDGGTNLFSSGEQEVGVDAEGKFLQITNPGSSATELTSALPTAAQLEDDYVIEFDTYMNPGNGMGRLNQYNQLAFIGATKTKDTQTYSGTYADAVNTKYAPFYLENGTTEHTFNNTYTDAGIGYTNAAVSITARHELNGKLILNYDGTAAPDLETDGDFTAQGKWVRVRAAVSGGTATFTVKDKAGDINFTGSKTAATAKITQIVLPLGRGDKNFNSTTLPSDGPTVIQLDNVKIYSGVANAPEFTTEGLRGTANPIVWGNPETAAGVAPRLSAPTNASNIKFYDFESDSTETSITMPGGTPEPESLTADVAGGDMNITVGNRSDGADSNPTSAAGVVSVTGGTKAIKLVGGQFATAGRSPMLHFTDSAIATEGTTVMGFSVYISKNAGGTPKLWLVDADKTNIADADKNTSTSAEAYYKGVVGVLTSAATSSGYTFGGSTNRGVTIASDEWHTVVLAIDASGTYRLFLDGAYKSNGQLSPKIKADTVNYGSGAAYAIANLPAFAIENHGSSSAKSVALIDNIITYEVDEISAEVLPEEYVPIPRVTIGDYASASKSLALTLENKEAFADENIANAAVTIIHAKYTDHALTDVKTYENVEISSATGTGTLTLAEDDTVADGDVFYVWDSLKKPRSFGAAKTVAVSAP